MAILRKAAAEALKDPVAVGRLKSAGIDVTSVSPDAADQLMKADYDKWTGFIRQSNIVAD